MKKVTILILEQEGANLLGWERILQKVERRVKILQEGMLHVFFREDGMFLDLPINT